MYRKASRRGRSGLLDLDSLMDILSCLVGVMLFLVIYAVLELGSAAYEAVIPIARATPAGARPVVVLVDRGTVRPLDVRGPLAVLLAGIEIIEPADVPVFVTQANERPTVDPWFEYTLTYDDRFEDLGDVSRTLALEIRERTAAVGDSVHELDETSAFHAFLEDLDPDEHWLAFEVDSTSVDAFRRARDMAVARGFSIGWSPLQIDFPFIHVLAGGAPDDLLRSRSVQTKPPR